MRRKRSRVSPNELMLKREHGDLHTVIPRLVNKLGQTGAAEKLSVPQSFISRWLNKHGYEQRWIHVESKHGDLTADR